VGVREPVGGALDHLGAAVAVEVARAEVVRVRQERNLDAADGGADEEHLDDGGAGGVDAPRATSVRWTPSKSAVTRQRRRGQRGRPQRAPAAAAPHPERVAGLRHHVVVSVAGELAGVALAQVRARKNLGPDGTLAVPQVNGDGRLGDGCDRVELGAALLRVLVAPGVLKRRGLSRRETA